MFSTTTECPSSCSICLRVTGDRVGRRPRGRGHDEFDRSRREDFLGGRVLGFDRSAERNREDEKNGKAFHSALQALPRPHVNVQPIRGTTIFLRIPTKADYLGHKNIQHTDDALAHSRSARAPPKPGLFFLFSTESCSVIAERYLTRRYRSCDGGPPTVGDGLMMRSSSPWITNGRVCSTPSLLGYELPANLTVKFLPAVSIE